MPIDEQDPREAERLLAATIYLMSCHARNGCPRLACMIGRHLELIAHHSGTSSLVRDACQQLAPAWEAVRRADEQHARDAAESRGPTVLETLKRIIH